MKKIKALSVVLAVCMLGSMGLTACGGGNGDNSDVAPDGRKIIKWEFLKAGIGTAVYEKVAQAYMAKNPDILIKLVPNPNLISTTSAKLESGNNLSDVFSFREIRLIKEWVDKGWVEDISDVYETQLSNGKTVKDSMSGSTAELSNHKGKYYAIPEYMQMEGFVYNKNLFTQYEWEIPETTADLDTLCAQIKADTNGTVAPLVYCGGAADGYLYYPMNNWFYQYLGIDNLNEFYSYGSTEVFATTGKFAEGKTKGLENLQKYFLNLDVNYTMEGSKGKDHIEAQTNIILGEAAMMPMGSWFETEMSKILESNPNVEIGFMKIPAMSDASGNIYRAEGYTTVDNKEVVEGHMGSYYFIPKAANNMEEAKKFLTWLNEPEANAIYTQYSSNIRPLEYNEADIAKFSSFGKDILAFKNSVYPYAPNVTQPAAIAGVISLWPQGGYPYYKIQDKEMTIAQYLKADYDYVTKNWSQWQEIYKF